MQVQHILAITKLVADYSHAADDGDAEAFGALFAEDGVLDLGTAAMEGRQQIAEFGAAVPSRIPGARHHVSNLSIRVDGPTASARSYLQVFGTAPTEGAAPSIVTSGRYLDEFKLVHGRWLFARRRLIRD